MCHLLPTMEDGLWKTIGVLNRTQPVYSGVFTSSNSHLGPTKNRRDVIYDAKNCARQSSSTSISKFELWKRKCGLELAGYKFRCLAHFHAILQCIKSFSKFEIVRRFELNFLEWELIINYRPFSRNSHPKTTAVLQDWKQTAKRKISPRSSLGYGYIP